MHEINHEQVTQAIEGFLSRQLAKKLEPLEKSRDKLDPVIQVDQYTEITEKITQFKKKYERDVWMQDAAERMAKQLHFGTHISKGVHPDSKGDNVNFQSKETLPDGLVGSQTLAEIPLDANGNAAALPLAAFFETWVGEEKHIRIRHLIQEQHPALKGVFSSQEEVSEKYAKAFKSALDGDISLPNSHERNKQLIWPLAGAIASDSYVTLIPLYPSSLSSQFFSALNQVRYSEANKQARDSRKKKTAEHQAYVSLPDIGVTRLGGTKPQNVSLLTSKQSGRNYLLPSIPPISNSTYTFRLQKDQQSLFNKRLRRICFYELKDLYAIVGAKNNVEVRDARKGSLDLILARVFELAEHIQQTYSPGWSKNYQLDMEEKYWLDPKRALLEDEEVFVEARETTNWQQSICERFALWVNERLQYEFPKQAINFADPEYREWMREIEKAIKASQRKGREVFA